MDFLTNFLNTVTSADRIGLVCACLAFAIVLEALIPMFEFEGQKFKHVARNLTFVLTSGIVTIALAYLAFEILQIDEYRYGLLNLVAFPLWVDMVLSLIVLDFFGQYFIHVCLHHNRWLWKLHLVHHSDTEVDASTGTRHHPGDILVRESLIFCVIMVFGIAPQWYVLYRIITPFFAYFTHANIALPPGLDRMLSLLIVTPNMHKFHHHDARPWTNTNYGNILSCWDRLFGTYTYQDPSFVRYGLDTVDAAQADNLAYQFSLPFNSKIKTDYE
jgi:sterol desaturase/sphingolipid hydroxylase (fatty acid hydroxylase superfamily)